jgi:hypothetical protein
MLEEFLAEQSSAGHRESTGCFTISVAEARRKMVQSGLDTAEKGLLRLVQLGVDSLCSSIDIKLLQEKVQFWFHTPSRGLLDDPTVGEDLQSAVLACMYSGFHYATFTSRGSTWHFDRASIAPAATEPCPEGTIKIELGRKIPAGFWESLRTLLQARTDNYLTFLGHLGFCPIRLEVDGVRPVTEYRTQGSRALELHFKGPASVAHLGVRVPFETSLACVKFDGTAQSVRRMTAKWETFSHFEIPAPASLLPSLDPDENVPGLEASSHLGMCYVSFDELDGGFIDVVQSGVWVGRLHWRFPGNVSGVVTCTGLDTDLSGLALVHNQKAEQRLAYLRAEIQKAATKTMGLPEADSLVLRALRRLFDE